MGTTTCLIESVRRTHVQLAGRLDGAREASPAPGVSRRGSPSIDLFLAVTSRHLHAVDATVVPALASSAGGRELARDYERAAHDLAVELAHVKGHESGSAYETSFVWDDVWNGVGDAFASQWWHEALLAQRLTTDFDDERLASLTARLGAVEDTEPTRAHPYLPHNGAAGRVARWVTRKTDGFWDTVESRYLPAAEPEVRRRRGLLTDYFLAQTHIDEDQAPEL